MGFDEPGAVDVVACRLKGGVEPLDVPHLNHAAVRLLEGQQGFRLGEGGGHRFLDETPLACGEGQAGNAGVVGSRGHDGDGVDRVNQVLR